MKSSDQVSILIINSCQFNSDRAMEQHLFYEGLAFIVDGLVCIPWSVEVHQVHFDLRLQAHYVGNYKCCPKDVLQDRPERSRLLVRLRKDPGCIIVPFTEVDDLAIIFGLEGLISVPDTLVLLLLFFLNGQQPFVQPTFRGISSSLIDSCQRLTYEHGGKVLAIDADTDSLLVAGHILGHIIYLATNDFFADSFPCLVREGLFIAVGVADSWHTNVCQETEWIIFLSLLGDGGQADGIT